MKRRTFLAAVGTGGLSGCSALGLSSGDRRESTGTVTPVEIDDTTATPEPTARDDDGPRFGRSAASVVDLATTGLTYALTPARYRTDDGGTVATEFTRTATGDHPATVTATLTNDNDFPNTFRIRWTPPFGELASSAPRQFGKEYADRDSAYDAELVFAPTANHDLVDDPPNVTLADDGRWLLDSSVVTWLPERVRLAPGETVRGEYAVVRRSVAVGNDQPTGVYEFRGDDDADLRIAVWDTDSPGPDVDSRFAGRTVPDTNEGSTTGWFHDAGAATYVRPSAERASLPARVRFTVVNKSRSSVGCGHWSFAKLVDGQWFHVGPWFHTADCRTLPPGRAKTWTLDAYHGEALPDVGLGGGDRRTFDYLGGGTYAVTTGYSASATESGALVALVGDPVDVVPTGDATSERDGETVTVTAPTTEETERASPAELVVRRVDSADRRLIAEQVMRERNVGLRNALAFFADGVERVVLRTTGRVAERAVGYQGGPDRFSFRGHSYAATVETESS